MAEWEGAEGMRQAKIADELKRRAESLSQAEEEASSVETFGLLLFRLGEEWYAFPIEGVREIYNDYAVTAIPRVPEHILGVINVRGEILSVTDLGAMMRVPSRTQRERGEVLPSAIIIAHESVVTAVVVDEIGDIVDMSRESVEPSLSTLDKSTAEYIAGSVYLDTRLVGIVNLGKILEPIGETA